jgi:hypothetical protein
MKYVKIPEHYFSMVWKCYAAIGGHTSCEPADVREWALTLPQHQTCGFVLRADFVPAVFAQLERLGTGSVY